MSTGVKSAWHADKERQKIFQNEAPAVLRAALISFQRHRA